MVLSLVRPASLDAPVSSGSAARSRAGCSPAPPGALLPGAAEIAGNLPAARVLAEAHFVAAKPGDRIRRDETGFAGRRGDVQKCGLVGVVARRAVRQHANQIAAELIDDRRVRLRGAAYLDPVL